MNKLVFFYKIFAIFITNNSIIKSILSDKWEKKLTDDLFRDYDSTIKPSIHHTDVLNVSFGLSLTQIIDVVRSF